MFHSTRFRTTRRILATSAFAAAMATTVFTAPVGAASPGTTPSPNSTPGAPASNFGPTVQVGTIKSIVEGHGSVVIAGGPRSGWTTLFGNIGGDNASSIADALNHTLDKAERKFDRNGSGNTESPDENGHFGVEQVGNQFVVRARDGGGVVGSYGSEKKANAVANALNAEADKQKEKLEDTGLYDPSQRRPGGQSTDGPLI